MRIPSLDVARRNLSAAVLLSCALLMPAPGSAAVESEVDVCLNPGVMYPFLDSQGTISKSISMGLTADWWALDYFSLGLEFMQLMGHKVPASPKALFRPEPMLDWERLQRDLASKLSDSALGYQVSPVISGSLKRTGFYFAPNLKFGKSVEGFRSIQRYYVSLGFGLYENELTGSISFRGNYSDGSPFNKTLRIERVRREDLGLSFGAGIMLHSLDSKYVFGMDLRYFRIMRDSNSPDVFLSPSFRFGMRY